MTEDKTNILIVGAGKGGSLLIELFHKSETTNVLGVVDINADAPGIKLAKELGIPTSADYKVFLNNKDLNEIINVTGSEEVQEELQRLRPPNAEVIGGYSARLVWNLIEERKQTEDTLRSTLSLLGATLESTADGILVVDSKGKIVTFNHKFVQMWQIPESIIESLNDDQALAFVLNQLKYPERFLSKVRELYANPNAESYDMLEFSDGRIFERYSLPQKIGGVIVGRVWSFRDVTDHVKSEEAVLESEKKYRSLFEDSRDSICIITRDYRFVDVNKSMLDLFGYTKEEMMKLNAGDICTSPDNMIKFWKEIEKKGSIKEYEIKFYKWDGTPIDCLLSSTLQLSDEGDVIGYQCIIHDITARKKLEEQLIQAQKMEAIGQLGGGIAHDFNNILTAIIGFGNLLKTEMKKDDPLRTYVTRILTSAERAANLTQALLAFSRRQIINPVPINLNKTIKVLENLLHRLIGEDIELSTILSDEDLIIMADSIQIEQVLMNLATNARDAMPDGGSLTIKTDIAEIDNGFIKLHGFGKHGEYAIILVEDTGHGMDEKTQEKIFEPFFTTKEVGKGTGLGLSMVYGIIKQHDGYINVYSETGRGTTFKIYLPLIKSKVKEAKPADLLILRGGKETVLVAEDDAPVRELIKEVLSGYGYSVIEAGDGEETIRVFNENKDSIQLLILDVIMPKKNGKEVYNEIKEIKPDIKAIFTSGYTADIIHKKGILDEGLEFILKPILPDRLLRTVREVLDK